VAEIAASEGQGPDPLNDRPELWPELSDVWAGWWQLHTGRGQGVSGPLPITLVEMVALLDVTRVTDHESRVDRCRWWREMDGAFFERVAAQREDRGRDHPLPGDER